jgi:4-amino-4-deoxy-L-arabinose transferase-like glycosyltransferase
MKLRFILIFIIILAACLRFFELGQNPPSLTWDEVAWGYNAYSLGIDGRDEFGRFLPHDYLESFGDFKPPVYAYLDVVPVKLFGLNEFAVRFPSAFFGTLTVLIAYFLTKRIFYQAHYVKSYALLTSFLLAVSPWHIMLSRAAFEANIATFFLVCGVWLFLEAVQRRPIFLALSAASFVLSLYTFNTSRIVAPILVIILTIAFWKKLWSIRKATILAAIVGVILTLPTLYFFFSPQARLRFQEVNIFSNAVIIERTNQEMTNDNNAWWSKILHNRRFAYGVDYVGHYLDNLSPSFLFIKGDGNPKFSTQTIGQMYLFELPFFIAGILFLFRKREKNWWIVPVWLLFAITPAATARETPHALRIETALPMFQILVAYGIVNLLLLINKYKTSSKLIGISYLPLAVVYLLFAVLNVAYYLEDYYNHYSKQFSREWQYGYKDAVLYMNKVDKDYNKVYLTKELGRPYIYTLFYKKYNPQEFRKTADINRDPFGFVTINSFGKYYFNKEKLNKTKDKNILFVDIPKDVPKNATVLKKFKALDGSTVMVAYTL